MERESRITATLYEFLVYHVRRSYTLSKSTKYQNMKNTRLIFAVRLPNIATCRIKQDGNQGLVLGALLRYVPDLTFSF